MILLLVGAALSASATWSADAGVSHERQCSLQWEPRPGLRAPRAYLAAAALPDGRILAIGGSTNSGPLASVEAYMPGTNSWQSLGADLSVARNGLAAVTVEGNVYAIGGYTVGVSDLLEVYDAQSGRWQRRASLPTARGYLSAAAVGGKMYAIGGRDGSNQALSVVERYDPETDQWQRVSPMPTARYGTATAVAANGRIYVFGGTTIGLALNVVEEYDPQANSWRTVAPMLTSRDGAVALTGLDGRIYVFGGYNPSHGWFSNVEAYDPQTNTWTTCAPLALDRGFLAGAQGAGGTFYAIGGARSGGLEFSGRVEAGVFPLPYKACLPLVIKDTLP